MLRPESYKVIYLSLVVILVFVESLKLSTKSKSYLFSERKNTTFPIVLAIFLCLLLGLRPIDIAFVDTVAYANLFNQYASGDTSIVYHTNEVAFNYLTFFCAQIMSVSTYFVILDCLYIFPVLYSCNKFFGNNVYIALLFFLSSFSFYSYGVNGLRQGIATSFILLMASSLFVENKTLKGVVWGVLGVLFHTSVILPFIVILFSKWYNSFKFYFFLWLFAIILSASLGSVFSNFFSLIDFANDDRIVSYLSSEADSSLFSETGFRLDFIIYSSFPILLAYYFIVFKKYCDKIYLRLIITYMLCNIFWILIIRVNFTNRFAYLSWFMYPLVLAYPLIKKSAIRKQGKLTATILSFQCFITVLLSTI